MKKYFFLAAVFMTATHALAHAPGLSCTLKEDKVQCVGSYSDGSSTAGVPIQVLDYNDKVLFAGQLDQDNRIEFAKPAGEYYVKFDDGPGHILEVDYNDIQ